MIQRLISHIDASVILYGAISVAAFWFEIQLCWSVVGKQWYSVVWRVLAALGLFVFLIPTTLTFHNFWTLEDPERQQQMIHFLKNLAILGGLLECCALGGGGLSIDAAFLRRRV